MRKDSGADLLFAFWVIVAFLIFLVLLVWLGPPDKGVQHPVTSAVLVTWGDEVAAHLEK